MHLRRLLALTATAALVGCSGSPPPTGGAVSSTASGPAEPTAVAASSSSPSVATPTPTRPATPRPTSGTTTPAKPPPGPVIVIDPGHSGRSIRSVNAATGLRDIDYPNYPEIYETFDVSVCVARGLRLDGYRVLLTKQHALNSVSLTARAEVANRAEAALAISVHDDHGQGPRFEGTYDQRGLPDAAGRYHPMYRGTGAHRTVFDDPATARASQRAAAIIAEARSAAQGRRVTVRENSFDGRAPLEPGNLAIVQLLSHVPWVYNEMGALTAGDTRTAMSIEAETGYAAGLLTGVERAAPLADGVVAQPSAGAKQLRSCLVEQARTGRPKAYLPDGFHR